MSDGWAVVPLGEVLRHRKVFITIDDLTIYRRPRVQLHARGIVLRDTVPGGSIKTKKQQVCRAGDFLVAEIDAKHGGYGMVPPELDGAIVSSHYFLFEVDERRIDREYLGYFVRTAAFRAQVEAQGSTNYAAIRPSHVLEYVMPLPPLAEQRRIVTRLDDFSRSIAEVRGLQDEVARDATQLLITMALRLDLSDEERLGEGWRRVGLRDVIVPAGGSEKVDGTRQYPNVGIYSFGRGLFWKPPIDGTVTSAPALTRIRAGQFIYSRLFAFEGAFGMVADEFDGYYVSNEYPTFDCDDSAVRVEFLAAYFRAPAVWRSLAASSTGLGDRRQRVQPGQLLGHELWLPPIAWQDRIVKITRRLRSLQSVSAQGSSTDALLPALLDRAFAGAL